MNNIELVLKDFPENVKNHELRNLKESGLIRSFRVMNKNGSSIYHYDIATWPGYLAISGDVGCFVFSRHGTADMLNFFREDEILENLEYIEEKLVAHDRYGYLEFCEQTLDESLLYMASDKGQSVARLREVFSGCESVHDVVDATYDYFGSTEYVPECEQYTRSYLWCIMAIIHGIKLYDSVKINEGRNND